MKKIILSILTIFSIVNSNLFSIDLNNNNNNTKCAKLPADVWYEILLKLIDIKRIDEAKTLKELKSEVQELYKFSLLSKEHSKVVSDFTNKKFNINGKETTFKEYYAQRKKEIIEEIKIILEKNYLYSLSLKYIFNDINEIIAGWTILHSAVFNNNKQVVELLIKNGVDLDVKRPFDGNTALMIAVYKNSKEIVELLVQNGEDINIQNKLGNTALIAASFRNFKEIVELLIKYGAKLDIKNNNGITALMIALKKGHKEIAELLKKEESKNSNNNNCTRPKKRCKKW